MPKPRGGALRVGLGLVMMLLAAVPTPGRAGGPVEITFPSASCPQENGLQGCIAGVEAGSTITIANEIVNEDIRIRKAIRLHGIPDLKPRLDSIDIEIDGPAVEDVQLRDLRVEGGIWARFIGGSGHRLTIERVRVKGAVPNTGSGITMYATVPTDVRLERNVVTGAAVGRATVELDTNVDGGDSRFIAVANRLSQRVNDGSAGLFLRHHGTGSHADLVMNNVIWDTGRCGCGISAGIGVAVAEGARVDMDIAGNTIVRSDGGGIHLRNDTEGSGFLRVDIFDTIIAHSDARAISRASLTGATTALRTGFNAIWRTDSSPTDAIFGPGTRFVDPRFVDRQKGRLRLRADSPLIDRGQACTPAGQRDPDADGHHRVAGRNVDIGAYESGAVPPTGIVWMGDDAPEIAEGTPGADLMCGFEGEDEIIGGGGPDFIDGGPDADVLIGGAGRDHLRGAGAADQLCALDGKDNDRVDGGAGTDGARTDPGDTLISIEGAALCGPL